MKRTKYITTIVILFFTIQIGLAQKIKVKKGKVLYNKQAVAKVNSPYRDHYVFATLEGKKQFTVQLDGEAFTDRNIMHYLKVSNKDGSLTTQIEKVLITKN